MAGMFFVDLFIHVVCGWGLDEGWVFCGHWFWMVPIVIGISLPQRRKDHKNELNILHIVPGLDEPWNGIAVAAKLLAAEQCAELIDAKRVTNQDIARAEDVWVHSMWTPQIWRACRLAKRNGKRLVRMLHGNLDPVRLAYHGWKKLLAEPIERWYFSGTDAIMATCDAEKEWIEEYLNRHCPPIEVIDIKNFFDLNHEASETPLSETKSRDPSEASSEGVPKTGSNTSNTRNCVEKGSLNLLYLGRRHPMKGLGYLESALAAFRVSDSEFQVGGRGIAFRAESNVFGEEKERVWEWCDVLVLPTLSENFGLVVAEALERGKRVITTDGAPAWGENLEVRVSGIGFRVPSSGVGNREIWSGYGGRLLYLVGYRDGNKDVRVKLLQRAIEWMASEG